VRDCRFHHRFFVGTDGVNDERQPNPQEKRT
jgi:hypothetical protein